MHARRQTLLILVGIFIGFALSVVVNHAQAVPPSTETPLANEAFHDVALGVQPTPEVGSVRDFPERRSRSLPPRVQPTAPVRVIAPRQTAPPKPTSTAVRTGVASTYGPGWDGWIAWPDGRGYTLRVCGA